MKLFARSKGDDPFARNHIGLNFFPGNQESLSLRVFVTVEIYESRGDVFDEVTPFAISDGWGQIPNRPGANSVRHLPIVSPEQSEKS